MQFNTRYVSKLTNKHMNPEHKRIIDEETLNAINVHVRDITYKEFGEILDKAHLTSNGISFSQMVTDHFEEFLIDQFKTKNKVKKVKNGREESIKELIEGIRNDEVNKVLNSRMGKDEEFKKGFDEKVIITIKETVDKIMVNYVKVKERDYMLKFTKECTKESDDPNAFIEENVFLDTFLKWFGKQPNIPKDVFFQYPRKEIIMMFANLRE